MEEHIIDTNSPIEKVIHDTRVFRSWKYPSIEDQLDMIWHMMDNEEISGKGSSWYNVIAEIKSNNPVR